MYDVGDLDDFVRIQGVLKIFVCVSSPIVSKVVYHKSSNSIMLLGSSRMIHFGNNIPVVIF